MTTYSALSSPFLPEELFDFERVTSSVLRKCFSLSGLNADSYCASKIKLVTPWELDIKLGVDWFKTLLAKEGVTAKMEEPLLAFAAMLDEQRASPEVLEAILQKSILKENALASLLLGRALVRSGLYEEAVDVFFQGILVNPTLGPLRRQLGLSLLRMARYEEAALHLEGSHTLRGDIGPQSGSLIAPILLSRPCKEAEVYFYMSDYHIVRRDPKVDGPSVIVIGNELYELRKNAMYHCARALLRIPLVRRLVMEMRGLTNRNLVHNTASINSVNAGIVSFSSSWLQTWRMAALRVSKAIFLRVTLLTLLREVSLRSDSFQGAISIAKELGIKSENA